MNISTLTQSQLLRSRIGEIQAEVTRAQTQAATGRKSEVYSGLRSDARTSLSLNAAIASIDTYGQTIASTKLRAETMQAVFSRIGEIAIDVRKAIIQAMGQTVDATGNASASAKTLAQNGLAEIASLLNTEVDGRFLFGGYAISTRPMIDPGAIGAAGTPLDTVATGAPALANTTVSGEDRYYRIAGTTGATSAPAAAGATTIPVSGPPSSVVVGSQITFEGHATVYTVTGVGAGTISIAGPGLTAAVAGSETVNYLGYVSSQSPSLYYQGDTTPGAQVSARIDDGFDLPYGVRGDDPAIAKILGALYAVATSDLTASTEAGYRALAQIAMTDLNTGFQDLQEVIGVLGVQQATLEEADNRQKDLVVTLRKRLSEVEDADAAEAISRMQLLQTNLEASYRMISGLRQMSLVNFL